jgi:uncharacterized protein
MKQFIKITFLLPFALTNNIYANTQPSFNCLKAKSVVEKIICGDQELAEKDRRLNSLFKEARTQASNIKDFERDAVEAWKKRERQCQDRECIRNWYDSRISFYSKNEVKNFLLGICEIPHRSTLTECSIRAIEVMDGTAGSYQIFNENTIKFIVRSSNSVPEKFRFKNEFDVKVTYDIIRENEIKVTTLDTSGKCYSWKKYQKQGNTIIVQKGEMYGSCSDVQKLTHDSFEENYKMKWGIPK